MKKEDKKTTISFDEENGNAVITTTSKRVANKLLACPAAVKVCVNDKKIWVFEVNKYAIIVKPVNRAIRLSTKVPPTSKNTMKGWVE